MSPHARWWGDIRFGSAVTIIVIVIQLLPYMTTFEKVFIFRET
jgi:hypothetical protein